MTRRRRSKKVQAQWTMRQRRYFVALAELVRAGNLPLQKDIAELAGVDPTLVSKWNRDEAFLDEVARIEVRELRIPIERAHRGMLRLAEKGNPVAYQAVMAALERQGRISVVVHNSDGAIVAGADGSLALSGTHIHIHGIPERQPMSALPPPLTLPASSSGTSSTTTSAK